MQEQEQQLLSCVAIICSSRGTTIIKHNAYVNLSNNINSVNFFALEHALFYDYCCCSFFFTWKWSAPEYMPDHKGCENIDRLIVSAQNPWAHHIIPSVGIDWTIPWKSDTLKNIYCFTINWSYKSNEVTGFLDQQIQQWNAHWKKILGISVLRVRCNQSMNFEHQSK